MSTFKEFLNHFFKRAAVKESYGQVEAKNLRIVKIYSIVHKETDEFGHQVGLETAKVVSNYVLVEKMGDAYRIIPTKNFAPSVNAENASNELHHMVIKKTNRFNRYRKPTTLCPQLANKVLSLEETKAFAEAIANVNSDFVNESDIKKDTEQLSKICKEFNAKLESKKQNEETL